MENFEPIFEREVVDYEIPVKLGGENIMVKINVDNACVVKHHDAPIMDYLLIVDEETQEYMRLWRQPENGALFDRLVNDHKFDLWQKHVPNYEDQEAYLAFMANKLTIDNFIDQDDD